MPRGGCRQGSGAKPKWKSGKTTTIRVPEKLAPQILSIARDIDAGHLVSKSPLFTIDLSSLNVPSLSGRHFVFVEDLLKLGYDIEPLSLAKKVRNQVLKK